MKQFDAKNIQKTSSAWEGDLKTCQSVFPPDVTEIVEYIKTNAKYTPADMAQLESVAYGIFADGKNEAGAVVKVIISKAGRRWIKMIDCHIRPEIEENAVNRKADAFEAITGIYSAAIRGSIALTTEHKIGTVKVYGRSNALLQIITLTAQYLEKQLAEDPLPIKVSIEGRWLVVTAKK